MRILIGLVILAVLAYVGFETFRNEESRQNLQEAAGEAATAARQAVEAAGEVAGEATREAGEVVRQAGEAVQQAGQEAALTVGGVDLGAELRGFVDRTGNALGNVRDRASAEAALPTLEETRAKLDGLADTVAQLPEAGRAQLASAVNAALPNLKELSARMGTTEGGQTLKPTLDAIIARLEGWAKAPA